MTTGFYQIDPLQDRRWSELVQRHASASVFHSPEWLDSLCRTYGYTPLVLTTTPPDRALDNGIVFCRVKSWLTRSRLVSLPFSDHCQPLLDRPADFPELVRFLRTQLPEQSKYFELRPVVSLTPDIASQTGLTESASFCLHTLDLTLSLDNLFRKFHKSCVQRKIQRAEREGLTVNAGRSESHLAMFYDLLLLTRRRHQLPPQPRAWFRRLIESFKDRLLIRIVFKDERPIASILTLSHKKTVVYKYGCSDANFHNLGGMPLLFWDAIKNAKAQGAEQFDFGRSELDNKGLISFKDNWGGARGQMTYYRYPAECSEVLQRQSRLDVARKAFSVLPDFCLTTAGRLLYRHIG
jgi:CelD/BcsL family acetyltransferase involved in cellulose biosynthesis